MASEIESFGLAALEALACEVPVVGYRIGGVPEVVAEGECGSLVPLYDINALAEAAITLLADSERLAAFRVAARRRAVEQFDEEEGISAYERCYAEMLALC